MTGEVNNNQDYGVSYIKSFLEAKGIDKEKLEDISYTDLISIFEEDGIDADGNGFVTEAEFNEAIISHYKGSLIENDTDTEGWKDWTTDDWGSYAGLDGNNSVSLNDVNMDRGLTLAGSDNNYVNNGNYTKPKSYSSAYGFTNPTPINTTGKSLEQLEAARSEALSNLQAAEANKPDSTEVDSKKEAYDTALKELSDNEITIGEDEKTLDQLKTEKSGVDDKIKNQKETIQGFEEAITNQQRVISGLQGSEPSQNDFKMDDPANPGQQINDTAKFNEAHAAWEAQKRDAEEALTQLELQKADAEAALNTLQEQADALDADIKTIVDEIAKNEADNGPAHKVQAAYEEYQTAKETYDNDLKTYQKEVAALQDNLNSYETAIQNIKNETAVETFDEEKERTTSVVTRPDGSTYTTVTDKDGHKINEYESTYNEDGLEITRQGQMYNKDDTLNTEYIFRYTYDDSTPPKKISAKLEKWGGSLYDNSTISNSHKFDITYEDDGVTEKERIETIIEDNGTKTTKGYFDEEGIQQKKVVTEQDQTTGDFSTTTTYFNNGKESETVKIYTKDGIQYKEITPAEEGAKTRIEYKPDPNGDWEPYFGETPETPEAAEGET